MSLDFIFQNASVRVAEGGRSTINTELILYNGPHNPPNPNGDFPYNQYVVFGPGAGSAPAAGNMAPGNPAGGATPATAPPLGSVGGFSSGSTSPPPGTDVNVRGYTRSDGTYVAPYTRSTAEALGAAEAELQASM